MRRHAFHRRATVIVAALALAVLPRAGAADEATPQPTFPIRAAFYYPWFPETWTVTGKHVSFKPTLGYYSTTDAAVQQAHIRALSYAGMQAAISSWWGPGHYSDVRLKQLLQRTVALGSPLKWAVYYEPEGRQDPTADQLASQLAHIRDELAASPAFLHVNGRFVVFVYNQNDQTCAITERWAAANDRIGGRAYVSLKVFPGYRDCAKQPDSWHQYSPAKPTDEQTGFSYAVSPGFWRADETTARLSRDLGRFKSDVAAMKASNARWQLVTTFNEWGEGTATESAADWASASGYGAYLDALHAVFGGTAAPKPPAAKKRRPDRRPPTTPRGLRVTAKSPTALTLAWKPATDDVRVAGYRVFRGKTRVATTAKTTYTISRLACGKSYALYVQAVDAARKVSRRNGLTASTAACGGGSTGTTVVVAAAGDIACDAGSRSFNAGAGTRNACRQRYTSDLLLAKRYDAVLTLGDTQYEDNALDKFSASFDPTWGRVKPLIRPATGNHEYLTPNAAGYFDYFGTIAGPRDKGYYSFDLGAWHFVVINSNCSRVGGCGAGSPQERWLRADLDAHRTACTLTYWHHPRWSSGHHGSFPSMDPIWRTLAAAGVELVLTGHDHDYERFAPQDAAGGPDANGIRQFVVGTGGANHTTGDAPLPNSEVRNADTFGVLQLTLRPAGYSWEFVPEAGGTFRDSGTGTCH